MRVRWKMLFKIGLTVIIVIAVYMFYALNDMRESQEDESDLSRNQPSFQGTGNQPDKGDLHGREDSEESEGGKAEEAWYAEYQSEQKR